MVDPTEAELQKLHRKVMDILTPCGYVTTMTVLAHGLAMCVAALPPELHEQAIRNFTVAAADALPRYVEIMGPIADAIRRETGGHVN